MPRPSIAVLAALALFSPVLAQPPAPSAPPAPAPASSPRICTTTVDLGAPPAEVFRSFTTAEGLKKAWSVAQASVDFRVGGQIRTRYSPDGDLADPTSIVNTILAYEPDRMLAIKATAPDGSPDWLQKICQTGWSVLRLEPLGPSGAHTRLTISGMGYGDGPEYDKAFDFFKKGNQWTLDKMKDLFPMPADPAPAAAPQTFATENVGIIELQRFVARGHVDPGLDKEVIVDTSPHDVFLAWTTTEGIKAFLGVHANIDLRIGGPMELHFGPNQPVGQRGSEGAQILSYIPDRMLSFSWNAPPKFPVEREQRTWIVLTFDPIDTAKTRVRLQHLGFGPSGEGQWDEIRAYFDRAWTNVLKALQSRFAPANGAAADPAAK